MKYINIIRHSRMSLYRPRSERIITDTYCPSNIYFASKLQVTLTYSCYFPLYCPHFFEKYKMKIISINAVRSHYDIHDIWRNSNIPVPENRTKLRWCYLFGGVVYKLYRGAFRIFSPKVFNWMAMNCVQGLLTVVCAHDCLSISVKWRLYFLISEIRFSDIGKWPNCPILVNQHDVSRYR